MSDIESIIYDVLIVGAGPAGASAAIRLAQSGLKVLLAEQKQFPREKLCGEFISPECLAHFEELNVLNEISLAGGVKIDRTIFYSQNGKSLVVPSDWFTPGSHALGLSRAEMDEQLLRRARRAGVDVREESQALNLLFDGERVCGVRLKTRDCSPFDVKALLTLDATGRARALSRQIEDANKVHRRGRADFVAFKAHLEGVNIPGEVCEIYAYRGGYGGVSGVEYGRHNLCFIVPSELARNHESDADKLLRHVVLNNRRAAESLHNFSIVEDWLAVPIQGYGRAEIVPATGLLTIGDAAAFIDPFTGSGILLALESAKIAAEVIANEFRATDGKPSFAPIAENYRKHYRRGFERRLFVSSLLRNAAFVPAAADVVIPLLASSRTLSRVLAKATRSSAPSRTQ